MENNDHRKMGKQKRKGKKETSIIINGKIRKQIFIFFYKYKRRRKRKRKGGSLGS